MFAKLDEVEARYEAINLSLQEPNIVNDQKKYTDLMREYKNLEEVVEEYRTYKNLQKQISDNKEMLNESDEEIREMAKEELSELEPKLISVVEKIKVLMLPKDPNDEKNIILEIRAGAGGDEASLFSEELFRAYSYYAQKQGWKVDMMSTSPSDVGGFKEVIANISGEKVYSKLKYESGVHRVQRVPSTETQGRVHTSTITVAVIPEADVVDVDIRQEDLRIDVYRSSGAGGQHVNTTDSAVRITHIPSGVVVSCQDEKSQLKNKNKAMKVLASRLLQAEQDKAIKEASDKRLAQIGTGDRSERIRTYNFPQTRCTDHRIGLTLHSLGQIMEGNIEPVIDACTTYFQAEQMKASGGDN